MGLEAATKALLDAGAFRALRNPILLIVHALGISYDAVEAAFVGYVYGASTCGQAALYQLGLTGIPITNVNNNCATGSVALFHAATLVRAGEARCVLALGFERMAPGALSDPWTDRPNPVMPLLVAAARASPDADRGPPMPRVFGAAAAEYFKAYGGGVEHLAKIGEFLPCPPERVGGISCVYQLAFSGEEPYPRPQ